MLQNGHDGLEYEQKNPLDFVEENRTYPVLWRSSAKNYKSREMRTNVLQELDEKYLMDSKSILSKIKSLQSYYYR
jgi:hypothetical protein